jgi:hypothetical protein
MFLPFLFSLSPFVFVALFVAAGMCTKKNNAWMHDVKIETKTSLEAGHEARQEG